MGRLRKLHKKKKIQKLNIIEDKHETQTQIMTFLQGMLGIFMWDSQNPSFLYPLDTTETLSLDDTEIKEKQGGFSSHLHHQL